LRNLSKTEPFGHDGAFATLDALLAGPHGQGLDAEQRSHLTMFLLSLDGAYPQRPWSDWPAQ
jgi:hypothetical protein